MRYFLLIFALAVSLGSMAQDVKWNKAGDAFYLENDGNIVSIQLPGRQSTTLVPASALTPAGASAPLTVKSFRFSDDEKQLLIYTNAKRVWRYETRGDYWHLDVATRKLRQLGKGLPASSLMFAKFSPDGKRVAYVSQHNLYAEDLATGKIDQLTKDGDRRLINGTFDWVYEEEFGCRDGFRWSPDSKSIAYWQIDARQIHDFLMINNTDSIYSFTIPVEYPKVGESPSPCKVGVVSLSTKKTVWMKVPGDPRQHYIPRMEWVPGKQQLIIQQLNRKQNQSKVMLLQPATGVASTILTETDDAWIDVKSYWDDGNIMGWDWLEQNKAFVWVSEKDGWRHLYRVSADGSKETLITQGNYDVINISRIDETNGKVYFLASPENATQQYLYSAPLAGGAPTLVTPAGQPGTHGYNIAPSGQFALHSFNSHLLTPDQEIVSLPDHKSLNGKDFTARAQNASSTGSPLRFFQVTTADGVTMDGWMSLPAKFDSTRKYPVVFYVYGEPASCTVKDSYGNGQNPVYDGSMPDDGYIYISLDNRGTPAPKGRTWRKSIYRKVGILNARDQAMAATEILKWPYVDKDRIAVWGWSGGGSMTLNLLCQYPEIYKTGIAVAAVANQLTYDNIYQERYMGLPQEDRAAFIAGSPITYVKNLRGKLLYIHGTGDDNVHYQNAEMLINELIKYKKTFRLMSYPNRSHGIYEGEGTSEHLSATYTEFLRENCPPGAR
ncbi:S9 family peptidase [Chitinophaga rhizosphaerae]|uniref:S9 family peptidase n=1 Tax=Chitinophaga rhizosphaerae TaxID=1864947 RepID=UPI000F801DE3|nr:S9 family peptidase [Chitinophaga rhizosphaerae]